MAFAETQKLVVQLDLAGNFRQKTAEAAKSLQGLGKATSSVGRGLEHGLGGASRALQRFDKATANTQRSLSQFGHNIERGIVVGAGAAVAGFVAVAKAAGDFEAQLNTIGTIVDRKDLPQIGEQLRKVARDTGVSLDDLTSAYYDLASAGVQGALATSALDDAVKLSIGGLSTTGEAVNLITTAINAYGLDAKGAAKATDQFALAIADGVVHADQIAASFADVASIAKAYGVGIDQIATSYAFLTKQGVAASEVTTEMQRAIVSLVNPTKDLAKAGKLLGVSWEEEIRKKGLVPALQEIRAYSDKTGVPLNALLGRIEAVKYTLQTTGPEFNGFEGELAKMGKASGVAAEQMASRQQGLNYQLALLKTNVIDAGISIGSALLPKLTPLIAKLTNFLKGDVAQAKIKEFATNLASGFDKLATAVQKVDWKPFIDGLKFSGDVARTVISAFQSLPADLQKLVVAGFALNKVTGGLGTSIVKDIGGAILGKLAKQRGSSPQDPLWVQQVGVAGAGGAAGGMSLLSKAALGVTVLGITYEASTVIGKAFADFLPSELKGVNGKGESDAQLAHDRAELAMAAVNAAVKLAGDGGDGRGMAAALSGISMYTRTGALASEHLKDDVVDLKRLAKAALSVQESGFHKMVGELAKSKGAKQIQAAIKHAIDLLITKAQGNAASTNTVLKELKEKLNSTHDPKTRAALQAAIHKVEAKVPGREYVQRQITEAQKLVADGKLTKAELVRIKAIQRELVAHGDRHAAAEVGKLITIAGRQRATTAAVNLSRIQQLAKQQLIADRLKYGLNRLGGILSSGFHPGKEKDDKVHAAGGLFQTHGPTRLGPGDIAGEAGSETVAILRNPRPYEPPPIVVHVSSPVTVRDINQRTVSMRKAGLIVP